MARIDKRSERGIAAVTEWLRRRSYTIVIKRGLQSQIHPKDPFYAKETKREIWIDSALSKECQLYTLLHEAGHYVVESRKNYLERYSYGYPSKGSRKQKTDIHWVHLIHEELEAWEEGRKLARRLNIRIRHKQWERARCPSLMSYFRDAVHTRHLEKTKVKAAKVAEAKEAPMAVELYWLDDMRPAPEGWIWVHDSREAFRLLDLHAASGKSGYTVWSFDHDLGEESKHTGYDVAQWIEERTHTDESYDPPRILIHSANPVGRDNLRRCADSIKRAVLARQQ